MVEEKLTDLQSEIKDIQRTVHLLDSKKQDRIPMTAVLAAIVWVVGATISAIWWAATINENVFTLQEKIVSATAERYRATEATQDFRLRDQMINWLQSQVEKNEANIDRILEELRLIRDEHAKRP